MKKEDIDERLMDALLRGEVKEDLAAGVEKRRKKNPVGSAGKALALVASLALVAGLVVVGLTRQGEVPELAQSRPEEQLVADSLNTNGRTSSLGVLETMKEAGASLAQVDDEIAADAFAMKPSAPNSAMAKVIASQTASPSAVPVPEVYSAPAFAYGDGDDFGNGWGAAGMGSGGETFFGRADALNLKTQTRGGELRRIPLPEQDTGRNREQYGQLTDQPWKSPLQEALSTFSVDVDTASYTNIRRLLKAGQPVPPDAVRIEELVNYFEYDYAQPAGEDDFAVHLAMASCPWEEKHHLVRVALQGKEVTREERKAANLVFLIDVSGSMNSSDKLPLLVNAMTTMLEELGDKDRVAIVVYAGSEGVVLPSTELNDEGRAAAMKALQNLTAGGSTNGGAGIKRAYQLARENLIEGGTNRVILATDGDFNVGVTGREALVDLVKNEARSGVFLSVCGFGSGNLNDAMLEAVTNEGNGVYYYIDSLQEARRVFMQKLSGTLVTIAKDVKVQVEFNPAKVAKYRLIGYANRVLQKEDFNNDRVDAGDIGAGHQVTVFYEVLPIGAEDTTTGVDPLKYQKSEESPVEVALTDSPEWLTVKLRHKQPDGETSQLREVPFEAKVTAFSDADPDFRFAAGLAWWGEKLRAGESDWEGPRQVLEATTKERDERLELLRIME
ncbi:MAG: VWA domain-containing protein [Verrucomicrobiota bacterium JB023]|nr:VWA domain-containing protein [Verrucomicrobiota bacterium JB023]